MKYGTGMKVAPLSCKHPPPRGGYFLSSSRISAVKGHFLFKYDSFLERIPLKSNNKHWAYICPKDFFGGLFRGGRGGLFSDGIFIGGNIAFDNGLGFTIKTA